MASACYGSTRSLGVRDSSRGYETAMTAVLAGGSGRAQCESKTGRRKRNVLRWARKGVDGRRRRDAVERKQCSGGVPALGKTEADLGLRGSSRRAGASARCAATWPRGRLGGAGGTG